MYAAHGVIHIFTDSMEYNEGAPKLCLDLFLYQIGI